MKITFKVKVKDSKEVIDQLFDQMGWYAGRDTKDETILIGEKFNLHIEKVKVAVTGTTLRSISILPKPEII